MSAKTTNQLPMEDKMNTDITKRLNSTIDAIVSDYMKAYSMNSEEREQREQDWDDVLDFKFVVDSNLQYSGVIISESLGGPSIYTNTEAREFQAYWGDDEIIRSIPDAVVDVIDEHYSELYREMKRFGGARLARIHP